MPHSVPTSSGRWPQRQPAAVEPGPLREEGVFHRLAHPGSFTGTHRARRQADSADWQPPPDLRELTRPHLRSRSPAARRSAAAPAGRARSTSPDGGRERASTKQHPQQAAQRPVQQQAAGPCGQPYYPGFPYASPQQYGAHSTAGERGGQPLPPPHQSELPQVSPPRAVPLGPQPVVGRPHQFDSRGVVGAASVGPDWAPSRQPERPQQLGNAAPDVSAYDRAMAGQVDGAPGGAPGSEPYRPAWYPPNALLPDEAQRRGSGAHSGSIFDRLNDPQTFTGMHRHRFDPVTGQGLRRVGREAPEKPPRCGRGTVHAARSGPRLSWKEGLRPSYQDDNLRELEHGWR
eukprot:TRINITY_DN6391_c1_g2_i1.p1 TRINITY_DN6391_c1_g2~~TRINITY_DN6391_c1_g2_i1.p1  ORF type:complete len:367 (+),score=51.52 TRINITY_DN6391_c1_g2_i1:69-1103(+)